MLSIIRHLLCLALLFFTGCSSMGLSLWPAQFPLLRQTKEFAASSPLPSGLAHELAKEVLPEYYIEPGDRILIEPVALDSEFRAIGDQKVQVDGSIDLGEYGRIRVAGMTVETIEGAIEDRVAEFTRERETINVQLIETNAAEVYVLGEVGSPGAYSIDGNETVLDAIVMAGGLTSKASPCDMILVRPTGPCANRVVQRVCYRQITQLGDVISNYQLQPGDRVVVGSRTFFEELAFWRQTSACECCSLSRGIECKPSMINYANRFHSWQSAFPFPRKAGDVQQAPAEIRPMPENINDGSSHIPPQTSSRIPGRGQFPTDGSVDDSDIFLPPVTPAP